MQIKLYIGWEFDESDYVKGVGVTPLCLSSYISMGHSEGRWGIGKKDSQVGDMRGNMRVVLQNVL
jgi:hypothetical protein